MRGFIILCITALAAAAPQGYNYPSQQQQQQQQQLPSNQYLAPGYENHGAQGYQQQQQQQQPMITKRFFIHSAPEEEDVEIQQKEIIVGTPRKNFNVVFVKSPAASAQKTRVRVIPAVNEEKTVIYVLAKKAGENEVIAHVEEPATTTTRPEVFFIKYKTNEEAEHAQRTIQAEYDRFGGSTLISNEGVGQVSSVIGSLDGNGGGFGASTGFGTDASTGFGAAIENGLSTGTIGGTGQGVGVVGSGAANNAYLPPVKKH